MCLQIRIVLDLLYKFFCLHTVSVSLCFLFYFYRKHLHVLDIEFQVHLFQNTSKHEALAWGSTYRIRCHLRAWHCSCQSIFIFPLLKFTIPYKELIWYLMLSVSSFKHSCEAIFLHLDLIEKVLHSEFGI